MSWLDKLSRIFHNARLMLFCNVLKVLFFYLILLVANHRTVIAWCYLIIVSLLYWRRIIRSFDHHILFLRLWILLFFDPIINPISLLRLVISRTGHNRVKGWNMAAMNFIVHILTCKVFLCLELILVIKTVLIVHYITAIKSLFIELILNALNFFCHTSSFCYYSKMLLALWITWTFLCIFLFKNCFLLTFDR